MSKLSDAFCGKGEEFLVQLLFLVLQAKYEEVQMELKETRTKIQKYDLYFEKMMQHSEATKFGTQEASKSLADAGMYPGQVAI